MLTSVGSPQVGSQRGHDLWRTLASPVRRLLLDLLSGGPKTTGELAHEIPGLSRFAVMQHIGVLEEVGLVVVRRRGRYRFNHLNPVPLREWYERWVVPLADGAAAEVLALKRAVEEPEGGPSMSIAATDQARDHVRTVRVETELRFRASPERVFRAMTDDTLAWFPHTYGGDRVKSIVLEPRVGGAHYEDWGDGLGHLYAQITEWDPPRRYASRGPLMPGVILDSAYEVEPDGEESVLRVSKVAVGPMTEEEAAGVRTYGDIAMFEAALRKVLEG
jgi:DNA-binding transcriptional ArsR family regulator